MFYITKLYCYTFDVPIACLNQELSLNVNVEKPKTHKEKKPEIFFIFLTLFTRNWMQSARHTTTHNISEMMKSEGDEMALE